MDEAAPALPWTPTDAIGFAWRRIKKDPMVVLVIFVAGLCGQALALPGAILGGIFQVAGGRDALVTGLTIRVIFEILNIPIALFFAMATVRYCLKVARGEPAGFKDIFSSGPFLPFLLASVLVGLATCVGFLFCIVPGVFLALCWMFYGQSVVDRGQDALDAMSHSWNLTKGHRADLLLLWLLCIGLILLGLLACCVGVIVTGAMVNIAHAWVYLRITGQETAAPPA